MVVRHPSADEQAAAPVRNRLRRLDRQAGLQIVGRRGVFLLKYDFAALFAICSKASEYTDHGKKRWKTPGCPDLF
jgi:hypothetical protein